MSNVVVIDIISRHTATVKTRRAAFMLDEARAPRQYNPELKCWTTSRNALPDLLAWLESRRRPVVLNDQDQLL